MKDLDGMVNGRMPNVLYDLTGDYGQSCTTWPFDLLERAGVDVDITPLERMSPYQLYNAQGFENPYGRR